MKLVLLLVLGARAGAEILSHDCDAEECFGEDAVSLLQTSLVLPALHSDIPVKVPRETAVSPPEASDTIVSSWRNYSHASLGGSLLASYLGNTSTTAWDAADRRTKIAGLGLATGGLAMLTILQWFGVLSIFNAMLFVTYIAVSASMLFVNSHLVKGDDGVGLNAVLLVFFHMAGNTLFYTLLMPSLVPDRFVGLRELRASAKEKSSGIWWGLVAYACAAAAGLGIENSAYKYASVALLQMVKETAIIPIGFFAVATGLDVLSGRRAASLAFIVIGGCLCVHGDLSGSFWGPVMQLTSNMCNATKLTLQGTILTGKLQSAGTKLQPQEFVALVSPFCAGALLLPTLFLMIRQPGLLGPFRANIGMVLVSFILALGLNLIVATVVQRISSTGYVVLGACKNAFIILYSFTILQVETTSCQIAGCCFIYGFATLYAILAQWEKEQRENTPRAEDREACVANK